MARKRRHYILTETAERDFLAARQWSLSRWGKELTKQYFTDLHERLVRTIGKARAAVKIGLQNLVYNMRRFVWLAG